MSENSTYIIAWWGAILASFVFLWDIYKWLTGGVKVSFTAQPNMRYSNAIDDAPFISIRVSNEGNIPTTITNIGAQYYSGFFHKLFRKPEQLMVINTLRVTGPIPHLLQPGSIWDGIMVQDSKIETMARDGYFYCYLYCSHTQKPIRKRIVIKELTATKEVQGGEL